MPCVIVATFYCPYQFSWSPALDSLTYSLVENFDPEVLCSLLVRTVGCITVGRVCCSRN